MGGTGLMLFKAPSKSQNRRDFNEHDAVHSRSILPEKPGNVPPGLFPAGSGLANGRSVIMFRGNLSA